MQDQALPMFLCPALSPAPVPHYYYYSLRHFVLRRRFHPRLAVRSQLYRTSCLKAVTTWKGGYRMLGRKVTSPKLRWLRCRSELKFWSSKTGVSVWRKRVCNECWRRLPPPDLPRNGRNKALFCQRLTSGLSKLRQKCQLLFGITFLVKPVRSFRLPNGSWKDGPNAHMLCSKRGYSHIECRNKTSAFCKAHFCWPAIFRKDEYAGRCLETDHFRHMFFVQRVSCKFLRRKNVTVGIPRLLDRLA